MKLVVDEKLISRLQLAGSIGIVVVLVVGLGFYFIRQHMAGYEAGIQALEDQQVQQQKELLTNQVQAAMDYLGFMRSRRELVLKATIREQVDQAYDLADAIYRREKGHRAEASIRTLVIEALRPLRFFSGRGYFFVDGLDGQCILLPISPDREGSSLIDNRDDTGHYIMRGLIDAAHAPVETGYSRYRWYSPAAPRQMADKIAYVRLFEPFGWIIGTGEYVANVEQTLQHDALDRLRGLRFGHGGYISVIADSGVALVSPMNEGRRLEDMSEGERRVVRMILDQGKGGGGFVRYDWPRLGGGPPVPKLTYVARMDDWGWTLAAGVYLDDIQAAAGERRAALDRSVREKVTMTLVLLTLGVAASVFMQLIFMRLMRRLVGGFRDDLRRQNDALRVTARELFLVNFLVDNSGEMVFLTDQDWTLIYVNTAALEQLGWPRGEVIGRPLSDFADTVADSALAEGEYRRFDATLSSRDGGRLLVEVGAKEVSYDNCLYHFAIARDVTERKRWEADLARKTADLQRSNADLEAFAYVASHDLRQPLRMVSSFLSLLERRLAGTLESECGEFIDFARDGATRMDRMILDLLEYSRVGRLSKALAEVPLAEAMATALMTASVGLEDAGGTVTVKDELPVVWGSEDELTRLLQNLIGNAIKYRSPDRVLAVVVECRDEDDHWLFSVADNGIGIAAEFYQRIFGLFQRLHGGEQEGTGIGLSICRKVVERHGGTIWVESEVGTGSTFWFTLPHVDVGRRAAEAALTESAAT